MDMISIDSIIQDVKQELEGNKIEKQASESKANDVSLDDLGLELGEPNKVSNSLSKIASELNNVNSMDDLVKIAEEAGNADLGNLVKIADIVADRIADRVINRLQTLQG